MGNIVGEGGGHLPNHVRASLLPPKHIATLFFNGTKTDEKRRLFWHGPIVLLSGMAPTLSSETCFYRSKAFTLRRKCAVYLEGINITFASDLGNV